MSATALPAGVAELLQAVHDALVVPFPRDAVDDATRLALFARRTGDVRVTVASLLKATHLDATEHAETLRAWTAEEPVRYPLLDLTPRKDTRQGESTPAAQNGAQE